jgi:hypothetical protein
MTPTFPQFGVLQQAWVMNFTGQQSSTSHPD